jgi:hypothetical protein
MPCNKLTIARETAARELAESIGDIIPDAFGGDAHAFLIAVYKDPRVPIELRVAAAAKAIRFEKLALATVEQMPAAPSATMADRMPITVTGADDCESPGKSRRSPAILMERSATPLTIFVRGSATQ